MCARTLDNHQLYRQRPVRLYSEGENRGGRLLVGVGVSTVFLYWLFRLLYGP